MKPKNIKKLGNIVSTAADIIHIGAHKGQEAWIYEKFGQHNVFWIEAIPEIYEQLKENLKEYPKQFAINELVTDKVNKKYKFYLSNNNLESSSIFDFSNEWWKKKSVYHKNSIILKSNTLDNIYKKYNMDKYYIDLLIIDVQGAELLVLKGADEILSKINWIYTEYSVMPVYKDGVMWPELKKHLNEKGFYNTKEPTRKHGNILFERK